MRVLNFGSVNIDNVYRVKHFVRPGETLATLDFNQFAGGKGFNQSIALANSGVSVFHAGKIGGDGQWLKDHLANRGVDVSYLWESTQRTGHAIIQVDEKGENCILLNGGANHDIQPMEAETVISNFGQDDWLLLQNEILSMPEIIKAASAKGMKIAFNPAPMTDDVHDYPLDKVDMFIINETEAAELAGETEFEAILARLKTRFPEALLVLTLGKEGAVVQDGEQRYHEPGIKMKAVDTTAAGDTFTGFFISEYTSHQDVEPSLKVACHAAAICVTKAGAAESIPLRSDLI